MRFIISLVIGLACLMLTLLIARGLVSDILGWQVPKQTEWVLELLSLGASAFISGYISRNRGWIGGFILSLALIIGIVSMWLFVLRVPSDAILSTLSENKFILLEFAGYIGLGASFGALGNYCYKAIRKGKG